LIPKLLAKRTEIPYEIQAKLKSDLSPKQLKKVSKMVQNFIPIPEHMCKPLTDLQKPIPPRGCVEELSVALRKKAGRNHHGKITVRHRGGGFKRRIRLLDKVRKYDNQQNVIRLEHDPNRSAKIALIRDSVSGKFSYVLASAGMEPGTTIGGSQSSQLPGSTLPLSSIAIGTTIHNIETKPGAGGKLVRSAGTHASLVGKDPDNKYCTIKLPSGGTKKILMTCRATIGSVSNPDWHLRVIGKAGRNRNLGIRPTVRGVAMNPIDHPHGGGKGGRSKGRPSQSPWGKICK
jgi:large subunit ribosomal protein L2